MRNNTRNYNQIFGYIVLIIGLILLLVTFILAISIFLSPETVQEFSDLVETGGGALDNVVSVMLYFLPIVLLLVMGSMGGRIAKYGIKLVRSPENGEDGILGDGGAK